MPSTFTASHNQIVCGFFFMLFAFISIRSISRLLNMPRVLAFWLCVEISMWHCITDTRRNEYTHKKKQLVYIRLKWTEAKKRDERTNEHGLFVALCFLCIGCISHRIVLDATFALFICVEAGFCSNHLIPPLNYIRRDLMCECSMFYLLMLWFHECFAFFILFFQFFFSSCAVPFSRKM